MNEIDTRAAFRSLAALDRAVHLCRDGRGLSPEEASGAMALLESLRGVVRQVAKNGHVKVVSDMLRLEDLRDGGCCLDCGLGLHVAAEKGHRPGCLAEDKLLLAEAAVSKQYARDVNITPSEQEKAWRSRLPEDGSHAR